MQAVAMPKKQTEFGRRRAKSIRYYQFKEAGLCTTCGGAVGKNRDGSPSTTCPDHRRYHPGRADDILADFGENPGYLDTAEFKLYTATVHVAVRKIGKASIGDLRRALGTAFVDRWIHDALDALVAKGFLRKNDIVRPMLWEVRNG